jgi:N-acyl-phosphatidylethanolamine-hydrolysing phospholipase D
MTHRRCSPISWLGPKRRIEPPCRVQDLPKVDICVISHDHCKLNPACIPTGSQVTADEADDHLDERTIRDIESHYGGVKYLVPTGLKKILASFGVATDRVTELGWWENTSLLFDKDHQHHADLSLGKKPDLPEIGGAALAYLRDRAEGTIQTRSDTLAGGGYGTLDADEGLTRATSLSSTHTMIEKKPEGMAVLRAMCTPAQHNSGRSVFHRQETLWCSWVLEWDVPGHPVFRVYFGG